MERENTLYNDSDSDQSSSSDYEIKNELLELVLFVYFILQHQMQNHFVNSAHIRQMLQNDDILEKGVKKLFPIDKIHN